MRGPLFRPLFRPLSPPVHPQGPTFLELARQGLSSTQRGYDLLAPKFEHTPFRTPEPVARVVGVRLARSGPFEDGLDLCCGTGVGLRLLRPLCARRVVGLDFSAGMLAEARRRLGRGPTGRRYCWCRATPSRWDSRGPST